MVNLKDIPAYCISYPDDFRRKWAKEQLNKHDIKVRFVDGVNPDTDLFLLNELGLTINVPIKNGSLGSFLAHRKTWKECLENKYSWIMEDDIYIKPEWKEVEKYLYLLESDAPSVIKLCSFTNDGKFNNEIPSMNDEKIGREFYRCKTALSNLSYIFNQAFVKKLWNECNVVNGKTLDYTMQEVIKQSNCYAFYPNLMLQSQECASIRNMNNEPELGGWSIGHDLYEDICNLLPQGAIVCELGSGNGTHWLSKKFKVISIEQNEEYIGKHSSEYYHAPIVDGWFDKSKLPSKIKCDLLLIDAPTGISRQGIIHNFSMFDTNKVIFDDVNREKDMEIAQQFCDTHNYRMIIKGTDKKHAICTWAD
jgi:GR25 family glycosyltransferase involved in LPS biosynthesis